MALGLAMIMAVACNARDRSASQAVVARSAVDRYVIDFWVKRDTSALSKALSPATVYYNGKSIPGEPARHLSALRSFDGAFPDLTASIDVFLIAGDTAATVTTSTGAHTGELCKRPGSGTTVSWFVNYVFRFEQGRVVELCGVGRRGHVPRARDRRHLVLVATVLPNIDWSWRPCCGSGGGFAAALVPNGRSTTWFVWQTVRRRASGWMRDCGYHRPRRRRLSDD